MHLNEVFLTIIYKMLFLGKISTIFSFRLAKYCYYSQTVKTMSQSRHYCILLDPIRIRAADSPGEKQSTGIIFPFC